MSYLFIQKIRNFLEKNFEKFNDQFNSFRIKLNNLTRSNINKDFKMLLTEDLNKRIVLFKKNKLNKF